MRIWDRFRKSEPEVYKIKKPVRPEKPQEIRAKYDEYRHDPNFDYLVITALENACNICKAYDGTHFMPTGDNRAKFEEIMPPHDCRCPAPLGCMCAHVAIYRHRGGTEDSYNYSLREFMLRRGGICTARDADSIKARLDKFIERRLAKEDEILNFFRQAGDLEKSDPERAIEMYQRVISEGDLNRIPSYVLTAFMRLSLIVERKKEYRKALEYIEGFHEVNEKVSYGAAKDMLRTMEKRRVRCLTRLEEHNGRFSHE